MKLKLQPKFIGPALLALMTAFQFVFAPQILGLLNSNLPFRESYIPNLAGIVYLYVLPVYLGFTLAGLFNTNGRVNKYIYYVNLALFAGLLNFLPFLFNYSYIQKYWFSNLALIYYLMFFPVLFLIGTIPYFLDGIEPFEDELKKALVTKVDLLAAFLLSTLIFLLNLVPKILSKYLVGADVYSHAAMSQRIMNGLSLFKNPFFLEDKNYYYSIVYYIMAKAAQLSHLSLSDVWLLYVPVCSFLFIFMFYLFAKLATGSRTAAVLTSLFTFPFNQFLWVDPSVRTLSYSFFAFFLFTFELWVIKRKVVYLLPALIFLILTAASHPEIALHSVYIAVAFLVLAFFKPILKLIKNLLGFLSGIKLKLENAVGIPGLSNPKSFLVLILIYLLILNSRLIFLQDHFQIDKIMIFNEIPLSAVQPTGIISFLVFLFAPYGLFKIFAKPNRSGLLLLAISSLILTTFFYFTYLWTFYHRYFAETAYFALAVCASVGIAELTEEYGFKEKTAVLGIILGFLGVSLVPKYNFIKVYSAATNAKLQSSETNMELIKNDTPPGSVILMDPDDMLNRYAPFYTDRYIFAGSSEISKEHQWQVVSFCNGPYTLACNRRVDFADAFFANPAATLPEIRKQYKLDYLFISKNVQYPQEFSNFVSQQANAEEMGQTDSYVLYKLKGN